VALSLGDFVRSLGIQAFLLRERLESGVGFNPLSASVLDDPYPAYKQLRDRDPVHRSRLVRGWVLSRFQDISAVLRDPRFSVNRTLAFERGTGIQDKQDFGPFFTSLDRTILLRDPPDHTRLRSLVSKAFTPRAVEQMRPRIQELLDELLEPIAARGSMDAVQDLANPLPVIVIAEMLGARPQDRVRFKAWSHLVARGVEPVLDLRLIRGADQATLEMDEYFREIIRQRRADPREDLISRLISVEEEGDRLSEDEMLAFCNLLLVAGNETTTNLIGNGLLALLRNSEQFQRLQNDPSLAETAVEELLRFDSPVQLTGRVALEDLEIGGKQIAQHSLVVTLLGAANRDPNEFADPDRLDIGRAENRHLAFGMGIHFCLGAPLARAESQIVFRTLAERFPGMALAGPPKRRTTITLRGLESLPVRLS
jgi:cytochrome P450